MEYLYVNQLATSTLRFNALTILLNDEKFKDLERIKASAIESNSSSVLIFKESPKEKTLTGLSAVTEGQIVVIVNLSVSSLILENNSQYQEEETESLGTKFNIPKGEKFVIASKKSAMLMYCESLFEQKDTNVKIGGWLLLDFYEESKNQTQ